MVVLQPTRSVGATGLEPAISCSQSRRASHYATPRQTARDPRSDRGSGPLGADDGNRTRVASLEDWGSTIELHPRAHSASAICALVIVPHGPWADPTGERLRTAAPLPSGAEEQHEGAVVVARPDGTDQALGATLEGPAEQLV